MEQQQKSFYLFLSLARGNWRNAAYVSCGVCPYHCPCEGFFLIADTEGCPVLISVALFEKMSGEKTDPSECAAQVRREAFESVYNRWLLWNVTDKNQCALRQITDTMKS